MDGFNKEGIYFIPLGGADDIGMNMFAYVVNGKIIVVDTGYGFLNDDFPGMDMCYASPKFLEDYKENILGIFITHAHEDHLGAIAHIWPSLQCPVYGMDFPLGMIKERLKEHQMQDLVPLISVSQNPIVELGDFKIRFISMAHSVPQTSILFIKTPYGNVVHATDWRFDDGRLSLINTDYETLKAIAQEGVDILFGDSTNIEVDKAQISEQDIREYLVKMLPTLKGGIVATCFPSNIIRLESLILAARAAGRTSVLVGRSLITYFKIARECGYLSEYDDICTVNQIDGLAPDKALYICTGAQANYRSAMTRIANDENKYIKLSADDNAIFSSKIIPGNEEKIERMQEKILAKGVNVITQEEYPVHTSGHANRHDLKAMYELLHPKIVFPVHGDKKFIRKHKRFALSCGIKNVFSAQNGDICLYENGKIECIDKIFVDIIGVDRGRSVSLGSQLVKNRRRIMYNCSLFISAVISSENKLVSLKISSIDILEENEWYILEKEILKQVTPLIEEKLSEENNHLAVEDFIRGQIRRRVYSATDIKPVTQLHVHWENNQEAEQENQ